LKQAAAERFEHEFSAGHFRRRRIIRDARVCVGEVAIIGLSNSAAAHYAPQQIRVNVIAPALTRRRWRSARSSDMAIMNFIAHKQPSTAGGSAARRP